MRLLIEGLIVITIVMTLFFILKSTTPLFDEVVTNTEGTKCTCTQQGR